MFDTGSVVHQTVCHVFHVEYKLPDYSCDRCKQLSPAVTAAQRTAIDLHLDYPTILLVTVSVHRCPACHHYFRVQPSFLRRDAIYSNRVVDKAVRCVYEDGMAMRRVTDRMARDFWVQPSEATVRHWCRTYSARFSFETDYQPWVVETFSGVLCVDEVYQDRLALLLAVDPAAPDGDRLVGYQLVHGQVDGTQVADFLRHLQGVGLEPEQVVTDGSSLYPAALRQVWPQAAHQLCLFHETRRVTAAAMEAINALRRRLPQPPPTAGSGQGGGPLRDYPPGDDLNDLATQRWYGRRIQRQARIAQVHALADQGLSQRAIARQTGHHRDTLRRWLNSSIAVPPDDIPSELLDMVPLPPAEERRARKRALKRKVHALRQQGLPYAAIAREVGLHRVTVKSWLATPPPSEETVSRPAEPTGPAPPAPWTAWNEVRQVQETLREHRFLLLRRPEHLSPEQDRVVSDLLTSPVGPELAVIRSFLVDWYHLWKDETGHRRSLADAQARYEVWRRDSTYLAIPPLRSVQQRMTGEKFEHLSQFLRHPHWEATNNGAERGGRAFRHRQAPHFNLRTKDTIAGSIDAAAFRQKAAAERPLSPRYHTCQRGRPPRSGPRDGLSVGRIGA
jgi:transposase/transposase-like protein